MKNTLNKTGEHTIKVVDPKEVPFWVHMFDFDPCVVKSLEVDVSKGASHIMFEWPEDLYMYYLPGKDGKPKDLFLYYSPIDLYDEIYGRSNT
jgi:hypothetical protein